jgi:AraC-like DNA-binding protein
MLKKHHPADDFFSQEITGARRFYLNMGPAARGPLAVAAGGWEACASDYRVSRQDFPYFSIEFVVGGKGELMLDGQVQPLVAGSVFSYGPGMPHTIVSDRANCMKKFFVDFRGKAALQLMSEAGFKPGICGAVIGVGRITALFEELVRFGSHAHAGADRGAALALELLMLALSQERVESSDAGSARSTFDRCQAHMQEKFIQLRTVSELAAACHVDAAYLCRQNPYHYLGRLQMAWVAERLLEPGRLVREVAQQLDMDPFQLSRRFRRIYGVSPRKFIQLRCR